MSFPVMCRPTRSIAFSRSGCDAPHAGHEAELASLWRRASGRTRRRDAAQCSGRASMKIIALSALAVALLPAAVAAAERPDWAFPPPGVTGAPRKPETGEL